MMEHFHVGVWRETLSLLRCLKGSLRQEGEVVPISMAGIVHAALCRLSEDIERPESREAARAQIRAVKMYHRVKSRGESWWESEAKVTADNSVSESVRRSGSGLGRGRSAVAAV